MVKYKKSVYRNFALISQFGISMIVPIALCVAIGVLIDKHFGTYWVILFIFLGMAAGIRNVYHMAKSVINKDNKEEEEQHHE